MPEELIRTGGKTTNQKLALLADTSLPTTSTPHEDKQHLHQMKRNIQSAETGVCSSCYDLLTKSDEDFASFKYHSDFPTLVESSTTCPCCFRIQYYKAGHPQNNRRNVRACNKVANSEYRGLTLERGTFTQDDIFTNEFGCEVNFCTSEACKIEVPQLPTRVIDIGRSDFNGPAKLITTHGIKAYYTALSHFWGSLQPLTTTLDTLQEREQGLRVQSLPKTFSDAIEVTRRLEIQYIWIHSLCIVQNDPLDWQAEAAQMTTVYQNAYLTLSATAASDGSGGLNWPFEPSSQFNYDGGKRAYFRTETNTENTVNDSPLGVRA
ncbi:het domain-containing protein [Rutstroemia sp. NJR-2017a WRK4]|nr:het domain-containing protein [Rutstroemia sp. NJR-2017a WRK4]